MFLSAGALVAAGCDAGLMLGLSPGDSFDTVLDRLHDTDVEFGGGLSNHGPMGAEALVEMGLGERVVDWVNGYAEDLALRMAAAPLSEAERQRALGDFEKRAGWIAWYEAEASGVAPGALLARELPRLLPASLSLHGLLRTAHAYRSLSRQDTPSRRRELAHALGYWASRYDTLPGTPGKTPQSGLDVRAALAKVPLLPDGARIDEGLIKDRMTPLSSLAGFAEAIDAVDLEAVAVEDALTDLVTASVNLFVAGGCGDIVLLHGVTASSATRLLLPALDARGQRDALGYAYQAVAAAYAIRAGSPSDLEAPGAGAGGESEQSLLDAAARVSDVHSIKLVEATLREHRIAARPQLLVAARRWVDC